MCFISSAARSILLNINVNSILNRSVNQPTGSVKGRMHSGISIGTGKVSPRASFCLIYVLNILYGKYYFLDLDFISAHTAPQLKSPFSLKKVTKLKHLGLTD